jgi:hypothetical protein
MKDPNKFPCACGHDFERHVISGKEEAHNQYCISCITSCPFDIKACLCYHSYKPSNLKYLERIYDEQQEE